MHSSIDAAIVRENNCFEKAGYERRNAPTLLRGGENPHRVGWLRGEHSIAELCRREGIAEGLYYSWSMRDRRADQLRRERPVAVRPQGWTNHDCTTQCRLRYHLLCLAFPS